MEELAIVILNWNGRKFLEQFLPSLVRHSAQARIIVADNASTDDSIDFLKQHYPQVELVVNGANGGFAKGYNDALKRIQAPLYLLINSDVEVSENWLHPLLEAMKDPALAACQPKIKAHHRPTHFEYAGAAGGYIDRNFYPFCRGRIFGEVEEDQGQYDGVQEVFWTSGACMLIRSEIYHQVGGFDEDFFAHMEEIDLCWRIKRLGHVLKVVPASVVFHVGGGTLNYESPNKVYLNFRNSLFMITKNYGGFLPSKLLYRMILDGVAAFQFLAKGKFSFFTAVLRAHFSFYASFRKTLRKRKAFKPDRNQANLTGWYKGSILWAFYFKGIRKFSLLNVRLMK